MMSVLFHILSGYLFSLLLAHPLDCDLAKKTKNKFEFTARVRHLNEMSSGPMRNWRDDSQQRQPRNQQMADEGYVVCREII